MERYEVFELIGEGSFGKVYKGLDKRTREHVALKMISKIGRHEKELISLRQECEIQKGLKHPNIIQMLDSVETADHVIVVTEYAKGDIFELLRREKKLPVRKVQFIAYNLVSALYYLHNHRILHRDIKPQNILIGYDGLAKLCDFGFARTMGINTYMLTSVKGTPLYMAPEIVRSQPYDHNADLWSLGCILFELINGAPPFPTTTVFELVKKIEKEDIKWPLEIDGDCKSFLQGLLIKDPTKRLTWPDLLQHPFVKDCLLGHKPEEKFSLTIALSPSQEAAKEQQREHLQKKLDRYSKLLIKTAKNLAEAQKELKRCSNDMKKSQSSVKTNKTTTPTPTPLMSPRQQQQQQQQYPGSSGSSRNKPTKVQSKSKTNYIPTIATKTATGKAKLPTEFDEDSDTNSVSSCETMTSTSSSLSSASEDGQTVILDPRSPVPSPGHLLSPPMSPDYNSNYNPQSEAGAGVPGISPSGNPSRTTAANRNGKYDGLELDLDIAEFEMGHLRLNDDEAGVKGRGHNPDTSGGGGGGVLWKSGALFTLHSFGSEDKPIESEEWIDFVGKTMKEVQENPDSLCEKHFLTVLVAPLRNHLAGAVVIEKIATLLAMPFTLSFMKSNLQKKLETIYLEAKVLPNLLYSCKLMVRRRRVERHSLNLKSNDHGHDMVSIMEPEDLDGMGKSMRLIAFLVHLQKEFAVQFCDSVCVLQAFPIFLLFLRLHSKCARLTVDTLSVLCHVLRVLPANSNIVEELLLDYDNFDDENSEILGMLSHADKGIQSKAFRLLGYLILYSEKIREKLVRPRSTMLWEILNQASTDPDSSISAAAEFTSDKLQQFIPSNKSSEGSDDADNLAVSQ